MNRLCAIAIACFLSVLWPGGVAFGADFATAVAPLFKEHCLACHNDSKRRGDLSLEDREGFRLGLRLHPKLVVPGQPNESLLIHVVTATDPSERMPLDEPPLSPLAVATLREWIAEGAEWPDDGSREELHWAYRPPRKAGLPEVRNPDWCQTPVDAFVLARLEAAGLEPRPAAGRSALLRRVYFDLIGLPPTVAEVDAFLADQSPGAFRRVVDGLLSSVHFGEKWARHWLDLARYADSEGYQRDELRSIWAYRDWVIGAFNRDLSFDQFSIEQLAGDLLPNSTAEQRVATGFHRNTPLNLEAGTDPEADYHKQVVDRVATTGTVWLGTTLACAQCHDHKYDPFSQKEYYQFLAFLNQAPVETRQKGDKMGSAGMVYIGPDLVVPERPEDSRRRETLERESREAENYLRAYVDPHWEAALGNQQKLQDPKIQKQFEVPPAKRKLADYRAVGSALIGSDPEFQRLVARLDLLSSLQVEYQPARTRVMTNRSEARVTHVMKRGDFTNPGIVVQPATPEVFPTATTERPPNRLGLAQWLVSRENPLVARVAVNRLWAEVFGRGIVTTPDDFGRQGALPSHPQLLDWLAETFVTEDRWSQKAFIRRLVLSSVYQQAAIEEARARELDPSNQWLWRHPGHRLSAELIRDTQLHFSGLLSRAVGGPPAYPWQPKGVWRASAGAGPMSYDAAQGEAGYRRGVYTVWRRSAHYPSFANFDAPDRSICTVERSRSNTPLQALTLLNDAVYVEAARAFALRIHELGATASTQEKLAWAFRVVLSRRPQESEIAVLHNVYETELGETQDLNAAWFNVASVLLNLHEAISRS